MEGCGGLCLPPLQVPCCILRAEPLSSELCLNTPVVVHVAVRLASIYPLVRSS